MALTSYDLILAEISDLFDPLVTSNDLVANLDHPPLSGELEGRSPVFSLHFDGSLSSWMGKSNNRHDCFWRGTLYINRRGHTNTTAETLMLQLVTKIMQKIRDDVSGTNYAELALAEGQRIQPVFAEIDGQAYRIVEISLQSVTYDN